MGCVYSKDLCPSNVPDIWNLGYDFYESQELDFDPSTTVQKESLEKSNSKFHKNIQLYGVAFFTPEKIRMFVTKPIFPGKLTSQIYDGNYFNNLASVKANSEDFLQ